MTEEEKKAIETIKGLQIYYDDYCLLNEEEIEENENVNNSIDLIVNLVKKQQEEIEHQIEKRNNQKVELAILNEKQKEFNKLTNTVKSYEGQFKRQQKELEKKDTKIALLEQLNKDLQKDFDSYKKDEDIHYLDGVHHKQLVEKSVGQKIDKPEDCWFDVFEVKVIKNNMLYGITTNEDFITLKQISDSDVDNCITVIAESPLSGAIYRYNNDGTKEWQLIGTMLGYA